MDRKTKPTLNTYSTWIQFSRLQKIYHPERSKLRYLLRPFTGGWSECNKAKTYCLSCHAQSGGQHCLVSMDSNLEAFSRNPTDGSFAVLAFQLAAFTKYLNEVFLSY